MRVENWRLGCILFRNDDLTMYDFSRYDPFRRESMMTSNEYNDGTH